MSGAEPTTTLHTSAVRRWKRYPEYRPTVVSWLPRLPAHWQVKRLKHVTRCLDEQRVPLNAQERGEMLGDIPYWGANGVVDHVNQWLFDEELVLLGEDGAPFFETYKEVAFFVTGKVWVNNHSHILRPLRGCDPKFLAHALNIVEYREFIDGSTRDKLTQGDMNSISVQLPPLHEQRAIVTFLDRETARIDALIGHKERLVALLEEKRQAVISHAVTRGLNPSRRMKEASQLGLGHIPTDWSAIVLKRAISYITSGSRGWAEHYSDEGDWFIQSGNLNRRLGLDLAVVQRVKPPVGAELMRTQIHRDDVLVCVTGAYTGNVAVVDVYLPRAFVNQHVALLRPVQSVVRPKFLAHALASSFGQWQFQLSQYGGTKQGLGLDDIRSVQLYLPSLQEQAEIVDHLDHTTSRLDQLSFRIREGIDRLLEYRTALISAAVTGQIDVRGEVTP